MLDLYLIRHAESEMNVRDDLVGGNSLGTPLSVRGRRQAELLGKRLKAAGIVFDAVHSSTAARTFDTALIAGREAGFCEDVIVRTEQLLEIDQGDWTGRPRTEIYTPETIALIERQNRDFTPPNGESQRMVEERMHRWITDHFVSRYEDPLTVGVFTHGLAIKCFLRGVMDSTPLMTYKIVIDNTAITRVKYSARGWHLVAVNDTAHIPDGELVGDTYLRT